MLMVGIGQICRKRGGYGSKVIPLLIWRKVIMKVLEAFCGNEITSTIGKAIAEAKTCGDQCQFEFNGVTVVVAADSDPALIYRDWNRGLSGYVGKNPTVGPYPNAELSAEEVASDLAIRAENRRLSAIRQEEYAKEARDKATVLQGALSVAGPIELVDEEGWNKFKANNTDGYGGRVVRYADEWARLMQVRISNGKTVAQCADELSHLADDDGITGYMYGCAVAVLAKVWKHGEALRRWHNKETQIGTEGDKANESGGVLNPALLSIG
jgi:hypothetical protein